jgi:Subtilase family
MLAEATASNWLIALLIIIVIILLALLLSLRARLRRIERQPPSDQPPSSRPPSSQPPDATSTPQRHFAAGQLILLADHTPGLLPTDITKLVEQNGILKAAEPSTATVSPEKVVVFNDERQAFSLITVDVPDVRDEDKLLSMIAEFNQQIAASTSTKQSSSYDPKKESADTGEQPARAATDESARQPSFSLSVATPNWLTAGSAEHNGHGGPGGRPVPAARPRPVASGREEWEFELPVELGLPADNHNCGEGVEVFILDTVPCEVDLQQALKRWVATNQHDLLKQLFDPSNPLDIIPAGRTHLLQQANYFLPDSDYVMSDHGLFVAGIIRSIAPQAKLHLVEVLNPFGVGTVTTIGHGFALAACRAREMARAGKPAKVLVNASLFVDVTPDDPASQKLIAKRDPFWKDYQLTNIHRDVAPIKKMCTLIDSYGAGIIAAAGNDGEPGSIPDARFPAAFDSVFGVGALTHDSMAPAGYSNKVDRPLAQGIATIGGNTVPKPATAGATAPVFTKTDPKHGLLGVYTSWFPDGTVNKTGWARWSGTSFATPIITGVVAALMSEQDPTTGNLYTADGAMKKVLASFARSTPIGNALQVKQG